MSFYTDIKEQDLLTEWQSEIDSGKYTINPEDHKIWNKQELYKNYSLDANKPWIYVNNPIDLYCEWRHDTVKLLKFIPSHCLNCWKVVVKPRAVTELFKLYTLQCNMSAADPECYCKCGSEERNYVFGNYSGFFYTRSLEAGLERYSQVREAVDKEINSDVDVILKRYCTEFELAFGPSHAYKQPDDAARWEQLIDEMCVMVPFTYTQSDRMKMKVMRRWIKHAWSVGDATLYKLTDGKPIVMPCVTYHQQQEIADELKEKGLIKNN